MSPDLTLEAAILRTVLYADVFDFALYVEEIHHFLMSPQAVSLADVYTAFAESPRLRDTLLMRNGRVVLMGREALFSLRDEREALATQLWPKIALAGRWLACVPFVQMVAVTGALAMDNPAHATDDFDYFIVTQPGRVWLARLIIIGVVRLSRVWGWTICPNFVLASDSLSQNRRDVYIAHEIAQAVPVVVSDDLYTAFRQANAWTFDYLPNAEQPFPRRNISHVRRVGWGIKSIGEWLLGGRLGNRLEIWERQRKLKRFAAQARQRDSAAQIDPSQVKGHFHDHGARVIAEYQARLKIFGLEEPCTDLAAD